MMRCLFLSVLLVVGVGCAEPDVESTLPPPPIEPGATPDAPPDSLALGFTVRGVYIGIAYDSAAAVVDHEAIPGFMGAMRMPIRVADRAMLRGLRAGDKIRFRLYDEGDGYVIQSLSPLPPETPLVLADTAEAAVPEEDSVPASADSSR